MTRKMFVALLLAPLAAAACGGDDGKGSAKFTTWGEAYIEDGIPADAMGEDGFVDGWSLKFDKFLVAFHGIVVANDQGEKAAQMSGSRLVDNVQKGRKDLVTFPDLDASAWNEVSYQIKPAAADSVLVGATAADRDMMVSKGYSMYVSGSASKPAGGGGSMTTKTFRWGFAAATQYSDCQQAEEGGHAIQGIVVTDGGTDTSELTTHGDHFFYDRLMASPDPAVRTMLRFEEKAAADRNADGEITLEELGMAAIDVTRYNVSGADVSNLGGFVSFLARTVGHFRGEGECLVSNVK
jgi:hypothetical protein